MTIECQICDCQDGLRDMEPDSIDLMATDPPYGLEFMGKEWDKAVPSVEIWEGCFRVLKPGAFAFIMSSPRLDVQGQMAIRLQKAGFRIDFTPIYWAYASGFPKAGNISKLVDKRFGAEREVYGRSQNKIHLENLGNAGYKEEWDIKPNPATPQAKALDGSYAGFQPKPAVEVIIVAMKPLSEKTYIDQALKNKKGITWLDDCRIPFANENDELDFTDMKRVPNRIYGGGKGTNLNINPASPDGRFPANLLVSDDVLNDGKLRASKPSKAHDLNVDCPTGNFVGGVNSKTVYGSDIEDSGSFSRYFSLDAWFQTRIKHLPKEAQKTFPFLIVPKAAKGEKNKGCNDLEEKCIGHNRFDKCANCGGYLLQNQDRPSACKCEEPVREDNKIKGNFHPTVKPTALMSYLITLGSREGDLVIDPFVGSGTTLVACKMTGRHGIGFEVDPEWEPTIKGRLDMNQTTLLDLIHQKRTWRVVP